MKRPFDLTPRQYLIVLHDLLATAAAIVCTFVVRFEDYRLASKIPGLLVFLPLFLLFAAAVYFAFNLHRSKWRFTSVPDLFNIFQASTVLAVSLVALDYVLLSPNIYGAFFFGKVTILLYWVLQMFFLGGGRIAYRYLHYARTLQRVKIADATPTLIVGRTADAEVLLRSIESGAVKEQNFNTYPLARLKDIPKVECVLVPTYDFWGGVGEPTICVVGPAVINAIFAATGIPRRELPLRKHGLTLV